MMPYGASILAVMIAGFLPWSYVFEALGKIAHAPRIPLLLTAVFIGLSTYVYFQMQIGNAPEGRGLGIITLWVATMHLISIAVAGVVWAIVGQRAARAFLNTPTFLLILAVALALFALFLGLTFTPST